VHSIKGVPGLPRFRLRPTVISTTFQAARTLDLQYSFAMARYTNMGAGEINRLDPFTARNHRKGLAMSENWAISRVGQLELEVGETLQEAVIRLQILPLPPVAWTDCFLQTVRGHGVTIIGTETHPDKIEAVARPAEVEDVLRKIDSAIENANEYVEKVVLPRRRQADPDVKSGEADERQKLQAALDQLAEKLSKPEYAEDAGSE